MCVSSFLGARCAARGTAKSVFGHCVRRTFGPLRMPSCESGLCRKFSSPEGSLHNFECSATDSLCGQSVETWAWCHLRQYESMSSLARRLDKVCASSPDGSERQHVRCTWSQYWKELQRCQVVTELFWNRPWMSSRWSWPRRNKREPWKRPDEETVERHNLTHLPAAGWCDICIRSRGRDAPHREAAAAKMDAVRPVIETDYAEQGKSKQPYDNVKALIAIDRSSGAIFAFGVMQKGDDREIRDTGSLTLDFFAGIHDGYSSLGQ